MTDPTPMRILYDGDCILCASYMRLLRLRDNFDVTLVNLRETPDITAAYAARGYDLSEGMGVELPGQFHYGADAVTTISLASSDHGAVNRLIAAIFRRPALARPLYPVMKALRWMSLALRRKSTSF